MKKKRRRRGSRPKEEGSYVCDACGETIVIPIDLTVGDSQQYVEDCPVCCRPNVIRVEIDEDGEPRVWAELE
jgi:Cysteine-rich CPXCG